MPIEIKELHIRIAVNASPGPAAAAAPGPSVGDKDALVSECVEQVLQVLQGKTER